MILPGYARAHLPEVVDETGVDLARLQKSDGIGKV